MHKNVFERVDFDELGYCIIDIECDLGFQFEDNELAHINTFEELTEAILKKLDQKDEETCTSQQAFYKLRRAAGALNLYNIKDFKPDTKLADILPRKDRNRRVDRLEQHLGFKLNILAPHEAIMIFLFIAILVFFVIAYFHLFVGLIGIAASILCMGIALWTGKELEVKTVRELVEHIVTYNYIECRNNKETVNRKELRNILLNRFAQLWASDKEALKAIRFKA